MRQGKLKESVWQRSVEKQLHKNLNKYKTASQSDALLFPEYEETLVTTVSVEPLQGWDMAAERLVARTVCSALAGGIKLNLGGGSLPHLHISVLMPENTEEKSFKMLVRDLDRLAWDQRIFLYVDYAAVSPAVSTLVIHARLEGPALVPERESAERKERRDYSGLDICMVGELAAEGTSLLAAVKKERLWERYTRQYVSVAENLLGQQPLKEMSFLFDGYNLGPVIALGEGGVFGGLWQLAADAKAGLRVELKRIPVRQHTIELCEYFRMNPYMLHSGGSLLLFCEDGTAFVDKAVKEGVRAEVIGRTTADKDRTISYDEEIRYLEPPKVDEIYQLFNQKDGGSNA